MSEADDLGSWWAPALRASKSEALTPADVGDGPQGGTKALDDLMSAYRLRALSATSMVLLHGIDRVGLIHEALQLLAPAAGRAEVLDIEAVSFGGRLFAAFLVKSIRDTPEETSVAVNEIQRQIAEHFELEVGRDIALTVTAVAGDTRRAVPPYVDADSRNRMREQAFVVRVPERPGVLAMVARKVAGTAATGTSDHGLWFAGLYSETRRTGASAQSCVVGVRVFVGAANAEVDLSSLSRAVSSDLSFDPAEVDIKPCVSSELIDEFSRIGTGTTATFSTTLAFVGDARAGLIADVTAAIASSGFSIVESSMSIVGKSTVFMANLRPVPNERDASREPEAGDAQPHLHELMTTLEGLGGQAWESPVMKSSVQSPTDLLGVEVTRIDPYGPGVADVLATLRIREVNVVSMRYEQRHLGDFDLALLLRLPEDHGAVVTEVEVERELQRLDVGRVTVRRTSTSRPSVKFGAEPNDAVHLRVVES